MSAQKNITAKTLPALREMKRAGEKIVCVTAYDATFAALAEEAGVDVVLVGDSLGMVVQGHASTVPVTVDDVIYHLRAAGRGISHALLMGDMPFMSYTDAPMAIANAARLMREGGACAVKLEGGETQLDIVPQMSRRGIPVCAHLGLQPQSVHKIGGYRVQGREAAAAERMQKDAVALGEGGADMLLLECVPAALAKRITQSVDIPVIGIGAGADCDGQILVMHDAVGLTRGHVPKFARDFSAQKKHPLAALKDYVQAARDGDFPAREHCFD